MTRSSAPLSQSFRRRPALLAAVAVLAAALLLRFGQFGNPIAGLDEQYYLLVGDRLWHGELPYVDLWDRKPFGLFVLFAAIRLLPGDGVLAAQCVAALCAAVTGWCVALIVRRDVGWRAAALAAVFYLAGLNELWGDTTQTPVFYGLLIAIAAALTDAAARHPEQRTRLGVLAMLAAGLAVQIKTNAVFEGAFFGLWLAALALRRSGWRPAVRTAALMALAGAAPTLAAIATYAMLGHLGAWWQANVLSVLGKGRAEDAQAAAMLGETVVLTAPVVLLALLGLWNRTGRFRCWTERTGFLLGWLAVSIADFWALGGYFPHYAIPALLAATPLVASGFAIRRAGPLLFALALAWPLTEAVWLNPRVGARERAIARQVTAALPADVRSRCLFIYQGPVIYYHLTHACRVTRFAFSAHLSSGREARSLGVDPAVALRAALARAPGTVLTVAHASWPDRNPAQDRLLAQLLAGRYRIAAVLPYRLNPGQGQLVMWRRVD